MAEKAMRLSDEPISAKKAWMTNPVIDTVFNFSAIWLIPLAALIKVTDSQNYFSYYLIISTLLIAAHGYAPFFLLLLSPQVRQSVGSQRPRYLLEVGFLMVIPFFLGLASAALFIQNPSSKVFFFPLMLMCSAYHLWNTFHYSMQHFGIMKLYRRLSGQKPRDSDQFDLYMIFGLTFVIQILVWTTSNIRLGFYTFFFEPPTMPPFLREICLTVSLVGLVICILRARMRGELNLPILLGYVNFSSLTIVICYSPFFFTLLVNGAVHWLQAVYLTAYQIDQDPRNPIRSRLRLGLRGYILFLLLFGSVMRYFYVKTFERAPEITKFGSILNLTDANKEQLFYSLIYFGFAMGLALNHFYLERFIYRRNPIFRRMDQN